VNGCDSENAPIVTIATTPTACLKTNEHLVAGAPLPLNLVPIRPVILRPGEEKVLRCSPRTATSRTGNHAG
jgi:hypothetical protein